MELLVEDLSVGYPDAPALLSGWSARIGPGLTQIHGDTGSGKTALLQVLAGALAPRAGRLVLDGVALHSDADGYRARLRHPDLWSRAPDGRVARTLLQAGDDADPLYTLLLQGFALQPHLDKTLDMLSTGTRRKLLLAEALLARPPLTLLDEPAAALDQGSQRCLWQALAQVAAEADRAVLVASGQRLSELPLAASIELGHAPA